MKSADDFAQMPEQEWRAAVAEATSSEALISFDPESILLDMALSPAAPPVGAATARRRNRAAAFLFLQAAARRGVTSEDPKTEALLAAFRRDALREAGVDERIVRMRGAA